MLTLDSLNADKFISVSLAIHFAEKALPIWEEENPEDMRPKKAIEAAKEWLSNPGKETVAAAHAAAWADANAAGALNADKESLIHEVILENLDWILQYKLENGQSFAEPELIIDYLSEEQKQSFLFNLDKVA